MKKTTSIIFDKNTVEFVTVSAEFCGFLERFPQMMDRNSFIDKSLKLFPLLYLKASLLPKAVRVDNFPPETFVTEGDYERIRASVAQLLGSDDDYLDVFLDDMAYSETPIKQEISETLADVYQPLKDFICVYQMGLEHTMNDALAICKEQFADFWGQRLLNVMRALHDVKYKSYTYGDEAMPEGRDEDSENRCEEFLW